MYYFCGKQREFCAHLDAALFSFKAYSDCRAKKNKNIKNKSLESTKQALAKSNIFKHLFYIK